MEKWEGLVAVVTGASSGIGKVIAIALAEKGMVVAALARRQDRLKDLADSFKGKGKIVPMKADVSDEEDVEGTFKKIEKELGPIRVLINNAAVNPNDDFMNFNLDVWRNTFDINFFGMANCTKRVVESAKKSKPGLVQIININSVVGHVLLGNPGLLIYSMTKHCMTMLTRQLNISTAEDDIKFTSLSPGAVKTEILEVGGWNTDEWKGLEYLSSDRIADSVIYVLSLPKDVMIGELTIKPNGEKF